MRCLEIMQQGRQRQAVGIVVLLVTINRKVHHGKEGVGIHVLLIADFPYRLVAESQVDAEATQALQDIVIVSNDADHLVVSLIHLLIFHLVQSLNANILVFRTFIMFLFRLQIYKKVSKHAIPRNGDANVYRFLGIARFFKTPYLCTRNRERAR